MICFNCGAKITNEEYCDKCGKVFNKIVTSENDYVRMLPIIMCAMFPIAILYVFFRYRRISKKTVKIAIIVSLCSIVFNVVYFLVQGNYDLSSIFGSKPEEPNKYSDI